MPFELQTKVIHIGGESLTVSQASNLMDMKRSLMISESNERWKGQALDGIEAQAQRYLETLLYPSLVACTSGNVPTLEEFVNNVSADDTEVWLRAVQELNPTWLQPAEQKTPEEQAEELEKNEVRQTSSSPD